MIFCHTNYVLCHVLAGTNWLPARTGSAAKRKLAGAYARCCSYTWWMIRQSFRRSRCRDSIKDGSALRPYTVYVMEEVVSQKDRLLCNEIWIRRRNSRFCRAVLHEKDMQTSRSSRKRSRGHTKASVRLRGIKGRWVMIWQIVRKRNLVCPWGIGRFCLGNATATVISNRYNAVQCFFFVFFSFLCCTKRDHGSVPWRNFEFVAGKRTQRPAWCEFMGGPAIHQCQEIEAMWRPSLSYVAAGAVRYQSKNVTNTLLTLHFFVVGCFPCRRCSGYRKRAWPLHLHFR